MQFGKNWRKTFFAQGLLCSLSLAGVCGGKMPSTLAAETVTVRVGPFRQAIAVTQLEKFAISGKLPGNLQIFSSLLTPQIRELLTRNVQVEPSFADKFVKQLTTDPAGRQLIASLGVAIPGSTVETLQTTINLCLQQVNGVSALSFLKAYPTKNVTIDATKVVGLAVQFNANLLQNQALGMLLEQELDVTSKTSIPVDLHPDTVGQQTVHEQSLVLHDGQRGRTIPVNIYYSYSNDTINPLVVISHGFGSNRKFLDYLAVHLASHGVTVAAIEHPGSDVIAVAKAVNTSNLSNLLPASEFIDRPKDISFLLDELAKINTQPGLLHKKFNTENVTVIGHSLGGYTALALVGGELNLDNLRQFCKTSLSFTEPPGEWLQCAAASLKYGKLQLRDERVKSAIALNPLVGELFGKTGLSQINKPVLVLTSTEDALTPSFKHQVVPFNQLRSQKYLLAAINATHLSITDPAYPQGEATNIIKERRGEDTKPLRQLLQGVSLAFVKQLTPEAKTYQPFLTPAYAQYFSTSQLPLRLVSDLPGNMELWLNFLVR